MLLKIYIFHKYLRLLKIINFLYNELLLVYMNEKTFNIFYYIYLNKNVYLRKISRELNISFGTVQSVINRNKNLFVFNIEGRNKYISFKKNHENNMLFLQLEIEKKKVFLKKNKILTPFFDELSKLDIPLLLFGSYANDSFDKDSDLDLLIISKKEVEIPEHLFLQKIHKIFINPKNISEFKAELLYRKIKTNYIVLNKFEYWFDNL
jgi:predicted nucleotidyltransferase